MKRLFLHFTPLLLSFAILFSSVAYTSIIKSLDIAENIESSQNGSINTAAEISDSNSSESSEESYGTAIQVNTTASEADADETEMRGVWIPYMTLTLSEDERSEYAFKQKIDGIIENCINYKINTIIVQVRPFGDAIYPSEIFPFSHIISGTQGESVDYDPLEYIIEAAHENGIAVHAWANLLRIKTSETPSVLSDNNPYVIWQNDDNEKNDDYTFEYDGSIYYNPAYAEVRKLIINGIVEIVENYDIDGIQFDDYFYPSEDTDYDSLAYESYCEAAEKSGSPLSQYEWRKANISSLIAGVYSAVHSITDDVVFGISPQGNIENCLSAGADVYTWCSTNGYIDYVCPQIYVSNEHSILPFNGTADRWRELVTNTDIKLYIGLGLYKAGTDADDGSWLIYDDNIKQEIEYLRSLNADGFMLYSYDYLDAADSEQEVKNVMSILD